MRRAYRHRRMGTECFHSDGKQRSGLGDCQLRNGQDQTSHLYMVSLAHSLLMRQGRAGAWALELLTSIGQACRAVMRQTFAQTIDRVNQRLQVDPWSCQRIKSHLALA